MVAVQPAVAEITVAYLNKQKAADRPQISSSADAHRYLLKGFNSDTIALQEEFLVAYMSRSNQILGLYKVGVGGQTGVVADIRLILGVALKIAATSLIVAHNHPSGNLRPSKADEEITIRLREAAKLMDIKLLDHLVLAPDGQYYSFADEGLL